MSKNLASYIDHTLLKPDATGEQIDRLCQEAVEWKFCAVCINPYWVKRAVTALAGTRVKVATVVAFPLGATTKEVKAFETRQAIQNGAEEIDMVINIGLLKSGELKAVYEDILAVVEEASGYIVKVILETGLLTQEEKVQACQICQKAGVDFVKTSTGFGAGGATIEDVALMRETVGSDIGVKASGGIRDREKAMEMIKAGATRIGTSNGTKIMENL